MTQYFGGNRICFDETSGCQKNVVCSVYKLLRVSTFLHECDNVVSPEVQLANSA